MKQVGFGAGVSGLFFTELVMYQRKQFIECFFGTLFIIVKQPGQAFFFQSLHDKALSTFHAIFEKKSITQILFVTFL